MGLASLRGGIHGRPAGRACLRREAVISHDPVGPEGVEPPVLEEDLDRATQGCASGRQGGSGGQLVVRAGEEHDRNGFVHRGQPQLTWLVGIVEPATATAIRSATSSLGVRAAATEMRASLRTRTPRIVSQATMISGSLSR